MPHEKQDKTTTNPPKRPRHFMVIVYPESDTYDYTDVLARAMACGQKTAYILHDKDINEDGTPKKAHYHICISFTNARTVQQVAKLLQIPDNYIEPSKRFEDGVLYLTHCTYPEKAQYEFDDIITNVPDLCRCFDNRTEGQKVLAIVDSKAKTLRELIMYASDEGMYDVLRRNFSIIKECREEEQRIKAKTDYENRSKE